MKLILKRKTAVRAKARIKNKVRIRKTLAGSEERPRLCVYRSGKHMYAQIVDDSKRTTLVAVSTVKLGVKSKSSCAAAKSVGAEIAKLALSKKIDKVVFDRSGYVYHGRVKAVAEGAREAGLNF